MVWAVFMRCSLYLDIGRGGGGVLPRDWYNWLVQPSLYSSKIEVSETYFFDTMIT